MIVFGEYNFSVTIIDFEILNRILEIFHNVVHILLVSSQNICDFASQTEHIANKTGLSALILCLTTLKILSLNINL